jgi:hypothetical protein
MYKIEFIKNVLKYKIIVLFIVLAVKPCFAQKRLVSITVDDLIATPADLFEYEYINEKNLEILKENNIEAIGFVNEIRLYTNSEPDTAKIKILQKWIEAGMKLGNHTFSHLFINNTSIEDYKKDVIKGELITRPLLKQYGKELEFFRHTQLRTGPTEEYRLELNEFLSNRGYKIAPVTIDNDEYIYAYCYTKAKEGGDLGLMKKIGKDYLTYMESIFEFYENLSLGFLGYEVPQILLLHANNLNADYLDDLVKIMNHRGYNFISIEEALKDNAYKLPEGTHPRGLSWLQRWMIMGGLQPDSQPEVSDFIQELYRGYRG